MNHNPKYPQADDAVLGGKHLSGMNDAILGGLEGVKQKLASNSEQKRIIALNEALEYGQEGLELLLYVLKMEIGLVQWRAYELLASRVKEEEKQQLQKHLIFLHSQTGANYRNLSDFLSQERWQEADKETSKIMIQAAGQAEKAWLNDEDINNIPWRDLLNINQLWSKYSQGRFGFGVQKQIYEQVGEDYEKFSDHVGWRVQGKWVNYAYLKWNSDAPWGQLPAFVSRPIRPHIYRLSTLLSRRY